MSGSASVTTHTEPIGLRTRFERAGDLVDTVFLGVAALSLFLMMIIVSVGVVMRYIFNDPLGWAHDFVELYLIGYTVFFAMSGALRQNDHVAVDLLLTAMPRNALPFFGIAINLFTACVSGVFLYVVVGVTVQAFLEGQRISGLIPWPIWPADLPACVGFAAMVVVSLWRALFAFPASTSPAAPEESI